LTFLKKFGEYILKGLQIVTGVAPVIATVVTAQSPENAGKVQTGLTDLSAIASIIQNVEAFGQALSLAGADKLKAAQPLVAQMILQSALLANHKIANAALFTQGTTKVADGMADILNSLQDKVDTQPKS
jgi:hypothetical protein